MRLSGGGGLGWDVRKLPRDQHPNFCCLPDNLSEDDFHFNGPIGFEIDQH